MRLVGHRGCPDHAPENTIAAVRHAAPHVDAVEVDARRCATGEVVVFHDDTVDRVTDATGRVDGLPWSTLRDLRVRRADGGDDDGGDAGDGGDGGDDATVPLLGDLLAAVPDDVAVNVELKTDGLAADVVDAAAAVANDVFVSSFDPDALRTVRAVDGGDDVPLAALFVDEWDAGVALADELDAAYLHPHLESVTGERVDRAHAAGLAVNAWTVRDADEVPSLRTAGVDGVVADSWTYV
jgi:glycerophosphoryl diester phosphodiesterase